MRSTFILVAASASLAACGVCKPRHSSSSIVLASPTSSVEAGDQTLTESPLETSIRSSTSVSVVSSAVFTEVSSSVASVFTSTSSAAAPPVSTSTSAVVYSSSAAVSSAVASVISSSAPSTVSSVSSSSVSSAASSATSGAASTGFKFTGVSESGAEFGTGNIPGTEGTDYTFPNTSAIDILFDAGMNSFRIPFLMERMIPTNMTGSLDTDYFTSIKAVVTHVTGKGAYAILDPHNYGRYYSEIITDVDGFGSFWATLAAEFADNELVVFDTNNEYHDMENTLVAELNQAAITAIRGAGATSQYIFVEGNSYTGAWTWVSSGNGDSLKDLTDPQDKIIYEMHQYLDSDGSGTSETCVNSTIGSSRLEAATAWLKENDKKGVLGETAGANNDVCIAAIKDELQYLKDNSDVWVGWLWWAAGPWWGTYLFSMEPSTGVAYENYLSVVQEFLV